jgi:peptidoglycan/xylan/chitin deacetylase (PgdA/CDA1 family)
MIPRLRTPRFLFSLSLFPTFAFSHSVSHAKIGATAIGPAICSVPIRQKVIALTFDDGPNPLYTPQILRLLKQNDVKATFFLVGARAEKNPGIVKEIVAEGHAIGNHTYTHPHNITADNPLQMDEEIKKCDAALRRITHLRPTLFRPPLGRTDPQELRLAQHDGYRTVLWTVCGDHHDAPTPQLMAQRILQRVRPGAILLLHDGSPPDRSMDVTATSLLLPQLLKQGYRFVTLPELLNFKDRPRLALKRG